MYGLHGAPRRARAASPAQEAERDHFSQFVVEDFADYIRRKRQMGTYGNHLELQAIAELYNRPILIYAIDESALSACLSLYSRS